MLASGAPAKLQQPFANSGARNVVPQAQVNPGQASFDLGFPPETMQPLTSGGIPPDGKDFNGILYDATSLAVWQGAGGGFVFDPAFAVEVGGYPHGACLLAADLGGFWLSTADNNTANPDTGAGTTWQPIRPGGTLPLALSNVAVTLTPAQAANAVVELSGTLTGNVVVTFPAWKGRRWTLRSTALNFNGFSVTVTSGSGGIILYPALTTPVYVDNIGTLQPEEILATQTVPGILPVATQALTNAITDDGSVVTPKKLGNGFAISLSPTAGYVKLPSWLGGLMLAWGRVVASTVEGHYTLAFGAAFPNAVLSVIPTTINNSASTTQDVWAQWDVGGTTLGAVAVMLQWDGQPNNQVDGWAYFAIGY